LPLARPSPPGDVEAIPSEGAVTIRWDAPIDDGGSDIVGYRIYRNFTGDRWTLAHISPYNEDEYSDHGLVNGRTYRFRVIAYNSIGDSEPSDEAEATPRGIPGRPENVTATFGDGEVVLTWKAPGSTGGLPILEYIVLRADPGEGYRVRANVSAGSLTYTDRFVTNGRTYSYTVRAVNAIGQSKVSDQASATPAGIPDAPVVAPLDAQNGRVVISWTAPVYDGGLDVLSVSIHRGTSPDQLEQVQTFDLTEGTFTDSGLTNGVTYYYAMSAENAAGEGPMSEILDATPATVPSAPGNLVAIEKDGGIELTWETPTENGGAPVLGFRVHRAEGEGTPVLIATVAAGDLSYTDFGAREGKEYIYTVTAFNRVGDSASSQPSEASVKEVQSSSAPVIVMSLALLLLIVALIVIALMAVRMSRQKQDLARMAQYQQPMGMQGDQVGYGTGQMVQPGPGQQVLPGSYPTDTGLPPAEGPMVMEQLSPMAEPPKGPDGMMPPIQ